MSLENVLFFVGLTLTGCGWFIFFGCLGIKFLRRRKPISIVFMTIALLAILALVYLFQEFFARLS